MTASSCSIHIAPPQILNPVKVAMYQLLQNSCWPWLTLGQGLNKQHMVKTNPLESTKGHKLLLKLLSNRSHYQTV